MDPVTIMAITSIVTLGVGAVGKVLYMLRHNIKQCGGIVFRSRSTSRNSPTRLSDLNAVRNHLERTLPDTRKIVPHVEQNPAVCIQSIEPELKKRILELQQENLNLGALLGNKLRETQNEDDDLVYI